MTESTSKELATRRTGAYGTSSLAERRAYAASLAAAGDLVPKSFWSRPTPDGNGNLIPAAPLPGAVLYMLETAAMLGVHPMTGLTNIHIIEGKPSLSAALWAALTREAGHRLRVWTEGEGDSLKAIATLVRHDDPDFEYRVEWGVAEMNAAGLSSKDNWRKYRRSMMKSRAITEVVREGAPEVGMGAAYTAEELNPDIRVNEQGEPVDLPQVPESPHSGAPAAPSRPAEPRPETPIVSESKPADDFDWSKAIRDLASAEEARALYGRARSEGLLDMEIKVGRKKRLLSEVIVEVGKALSEAEAAAPEDDVVEAEIVDDEPPAVLEEPSGPAAQADAAQG